LKTNNKDINFKEEEKYKFLKNDFEEENIIKNKVVEKEEIKNIVEEKEEEEEEEEEKYIINENKYFINKKKKKYNSNNNINNNNNFINKIQKILWKYLEQEKDFKNNYEKTIGFFVQLICFVFLSLFSVIIAILETEKLFTNLFWISLLFFLLDLILILYFTMEFLLRFWSCNNY
jgi:hypothetical protein